MLSLLIGFQFVNYEWIDVKLFSYYVYDNIFYHILKYLEITWKLYAFWNLKSEKFFTLCCWNLKWFSIITNRFFPILLSHKCIISHKEYSFQQIQEETNSGWVDMYEAPVFSQNKRYYFLRSPVADGKAGRFKHVASYDLEVSHFKTYFYVILFSYNSDS